MKKIDLQAELRTTTGGSTARALRRAGRIPATLYGPELDAPLSLSVDWLALEKLLHSDSTALINLSIPGRGEVLSLLKAHQEHRVRGNAVHVDFYKVAANHTFTTVIPIEVVGNAPGVKAGGVLERAVREVEIECLPQDLPEHLVIDVSTLEIGDSLHVSDVPLPPGVTIRAPEPTTTLVHVGISRAAVAAEEEAEAAAAAAEPALVGREAGQEEGGEG